MKCHKIPKMTYPLGQDSSMTVNHAREKGWESYPRKQAGAFERCPKTEVQRLPECQVRTFKHTLPEIKKRIKTTLGAK